LYQTPARPPVIPDAASVGVRPTVTEAAVEDAGASSLVTGAVVSTCTV